MAIGSVDAQPLRFVRTYDLPSPTRGKDLLQTPDGGYLLLGDGPDSIGGTVRPFLLKTDAHGNPIWKKPFGQSSYNNNVHLQSLPLGRYLLTGLVEKNYPWWMVIDSSGQLVDSLTLTKPAPSEVFISTVDQRFLFCKTDMLTHQHIADDIPFGLTLSAISNFGDSLWTKRFFAGGKFEIPWVSSLVLAKNGEIFLIGDEGIKYTSNQGPSVFCIRANAEGDSLWKASHWTSSTLSFSITSTIETKDSGIVILQAISQVGHFPEIGVSKFSKNGSILFHRQYSAPYSQSMGWYPRAMTEMIGGGLAITYTTAPMPYRGTKTPGGFLLMTDASGSTISNLQFVSGPGVYDVSAITVTSDSGFAIAGTIDESIPFLARTDKHGVISSIDTPLPSDVPFSFELVGNYPNPFNSVTKVLIKVGTFEQVHLSIFNSIGQHIATIANRTFNPGSHVLEWDATQHPSGAYFCRMSVGSVTLMRPMLHLK